MKSEKLVRVFRERLLHVSKQRRFVEVIEVCDPELSIAFTESDHVLQTASYGIGNSCDEPLTYAA